MLSTQHVNRVRLALAKRPEVRRAILVDAGPRPTLVFEYDERPASVESAQAAIQELVAAVAPALGSAASQVGFSAGGPEEVAGFGSGELVYEREER